MGCDTATVVWQCVAAVGCCEATGRAGLTVAAAVRDRRRLTGCSPSLGSLANSDECCEAKSEMESVKPGRLQKSSIFSSRPRDASAEVACVY